MKTIAKWFLLLNKRLYKKKIFLILLALIPILVLALGISAQEKSGFVHIALAQTDPNDSLSAQIIQELSDSNRLTTYSLCNTPEEAKELVKTGQADAAWIFREDLAERLLAFSKSTDQTNYLVNVIERQDNVALRLSREKLSGILFKYSSDHVYMNFVRTELPVLDSVSDAQLMEYYSAYLQDTPLFEFPAGADVSDPSAGSYLLMPIRGLLSILVVLCALAGAMFYIKDDTQGTFSHIPLGKKFFVELGCQAIAVANISVAVIIALIITGLSVPLYREIGIGLMYVLCCALFGMLIRRIFNNVKFFGAIIPLFTTLMIGVCPVFFEFRVTRPLQLLFPPTYYINAIYNNRYIVYMALYSLLMFLVLLCMRKVELRNRITT